MEYWVTFPSRFSEFGKIHDEGCRYFGEGHGRKLTPSEIAVYAPKADNCKVCGGWGGV